jgi:hypothetical protein
MWDEFLARLVERVRANAAGVEAAPEAFVVLAVIAFGLPCLALQHSYGERVAELQSKLATQQALLADHRAKLRAASSTRDVAAQTEEPRPLAAGMQARGKDRDRRTRDLERFYADDIPVALVAAPPVNSDEKTLTFPEITSATLLATDRPYQYKNWILSCGGAQSYSTRGGGATRQFSYSHLICKIVGDR